MIALYRYAKKKHTSKVKNDSAQQVVNEKAEAEQQDHAPVERTTASNSNSNSNSTHTAEEATTTTARKRVSRAYTWKLNLCLWLPFFLSSLNLTVVATSLPFIASHFDKFNELNWAVTSFTLTSTAFIPLFGQLADTFGRHSALQLAVGSITIGSVICAAAPAWSVLLLGRALQGLGTAGVSNVVMIILVDKVTLEEQARNTSIFQLAGGLGYAVGPVIGGYLTDSSWRYCFVLPAAIGAISMFTILPLRNDLVGGSVSISKQVVGTSRLSTLISGLKIIDFGGALLFIASVGLIILGTAWGGSTYAWSSAAVIAPLVIGVLLFPVFILFEWLLEPGQKLSSLSPTTIPMIPISVFRTKDVGVTSIIAAGTGAALFSVFYFVGIYFVVVEGRASSDAGLQLLYYIPGLGIGVVLAILLCNKWPRQTFPPLVIGTVIETGGIAALTYGVKARNTVLVNVMMAIAGVGTGIRFMPSNLHIAGMMRDQLAPSLSMLRFSQPFGGTLALTIMGAVFQNKMAKYFGNTSTGNRLNLHDSAALDAISQLPADQQHAIRMASADATMWAFISILPFLALSTFVSFGLGNVWIPRTKQGIPPQVSRSEAGVLGRTAAACSSVADRGFFLLHCILGRTRQEQANNTGSSSDDSSEAIVTKT